ncbi:MAG: hypothetical protein IJ057_10445 [Bacteroidales bacterium]|nr:hypothetical protein [Bacteroidales bacterium]
MSENTVRLKIKIDDDFKTVGTNADDLRKAIEQVKNEADKVNSSLINSNQIAQAFEQVSSAVQGLQSIMHDLTDTYAVQAAAETRLEQVMRNTMEATDAEIKSIKDLASAQQQLGIVGDEVQLSGAQELASYLSKKDSLEALIPVMNDMIAQQYGYNATSESAIQIASMMGKVMDGQVKALSRYGYSFTEAQEEILKFGTEEERAATLAEVIESSVGGVNAALAATPYGKIVQANNAFGDLKETIGGLIAPAMRAVDNIARISLAVAGVGRGVATVKSLSASIQALGVRSRVTATAQRMLGAAGISAAAGTTALKIAVTGLYAAMTLGLSAAITAIVTLITRLADKSRDAADGMDELNDANEAYKSAASSAKAEIDSEVAALKNLIDSGKDTTEAIQHLNEKYGEAFGYHQTAADWYDTLTSKSETYCRQLGYEAKAKSLSASIGAKIVERDELKESLPVGDWQWDAKAKKYRDMSATFTLIYADKDTHKKLAQTANLNKQIEEGTRQIESAYGEAGKAADGLGGSVDGGTQSVDWQTMSYAKLGKAINDQKKKVEEAIGTNDAVAAAEGAMLQAMQNRYSELGKQLDKVTGKMKNLGNEMRRTEQGKIPALASIGTPSSIGTPEPTFAQPQPLKGLFDFKNLGEFEQRLTELENIRKQVSQDQLPVIDAQIALVQRLKDEFEGVNQTVAQMPSFSDAWGGIKGIGNSIRDIKDALTDTDNAWDALTQTIDGFISLFQSIQSVIGIIENITAATKTMQAVRDAATQKELGNAAVEVAANTAKAGSGAASSVASIPYVGPVLAIAAMASVIAALASLPKFANGGLVYGPTLGLMGEYGGASSNPEVIAPLNKLRALIGNDGGTGRSEVKFRIEGRELVGILNKQNNIYTRSK